MQYNRRHCGAPGWLSRLSVRLWLRSWSRGQWVRARIRLCADCSEPGACFRFCVSLSLTLPRSFSVSLCLKNKQTLKKKQKTIEGIECFTYNLSKLHRLDPRLWNVFTASFQVNILLMGPNIANNNTNKIYRTRKDNRTKANGNLCQITGRQKSCCKQHGNNN